MKALNKILAGFHRTITDLEKLSDNRAADAEESRCKADEAIAQAHAQSTESRLARNVAANIRAMLKDVPPPV